jgi:hypothetical protein
VQTDGEKQPQFKGKSKKKRQREEFLKKHIFAIDTTVNTVDTVPTVLFYLDRRTQR